MRLPLLPLLLPSSPLSAPLLHPVSPLRTSTPRLQVAAEPKLADFAVTGSPTIVTSDGASANTNSSKPVLLYLPGIELSGYSLHRQVEELSADFDVRWLACPAADRSSFDDLADMVTDAISAEERPTYLVGESFGGVLALTVALRAGKPPAGLAGLVLINPATSIAKAWPARLPVLLDALAALPAGLSDVAYLAIATPIFAAISGDPLQLGGRRADANLPPPIQLANTLGRLTAQLPELGSLPSALPLPTLAYRLAMLTRAAEAADELKLSSLQLPVQVIASTEDKVLPSTDEGRRLVRSLPNARLTTLEASGHVPLLEARVALREVLREAELTARAPLPKKDYVSDFTFPTAEDFANASRTIGNVRKLTSPVFLSTMPDGRRVAGLGGLPERLSVSEGGAMPAAGTRSKPTLFIGNHQLYGFLDLPLLVEEVYQQTGTLVRGLAHPVAFRTNRATDGGERGGGGGGFVDFEKFGAVPVSPRALFKLMSRGESALLYPGGVREAFKSTKRGEGYKIFWPDEEGTSDFARVAARFDATIVPVAAVGAEEGFEMLLDADELLSLPVLGERVAKSAKNTPVGRPGERFVSPVSVPKLPGRYYFLFGSPIETDGVDPNDKEACAALYAGVQAELEASLRYVLDRRANDPYEAVLPRAAVEATWNWTKQAPSFPL